MASESMRHIKGLSDTIWADYTNWPGFDEASLEADTLNKFLNRKEAIKAYLSGIEVAVNRPELTRHSLASLKIGFQNPQATSRW